jgi:signal transduction histidine kinase
VSNKELGTLDVLARLSQSLTDPGLGSNNLAVAEVVLRELKPIGFDNLGLFLFSEDFDLDLIASEPASDKALVAQMMEEASDAGALAVTLQHGRGSYLPDGRGEHEAMHLRVIGTRDRELGILVATTDNRRTNSTLSEAALTTAVSLAAYRFDNIRLNADMLAHNESLRDQVAERTKEYTEAAEQARAADKAKSEFLANMSHEIRTPLNGVVGLLDLLRVDESLDEGHRDSVITASNCANALLSLLNDILDLAKVEAGRMETNIEPFDPLKLIDEVSSVLTVQAQAKGIDLRSQCDIGPNTLLDGDAGHLRQILFNLSGNAIKFTQNGTVTVSCTTVGHRSDGLLVRFAVSDTGIGIPKEAQRNIFDAFAQADGSTRRQFGGTGLGLAISSRLVNLMDGHLELQSEPGAGSTFSFTIPLPISESDSGSDGTAGDSGELPKTKDLRGLQVLIVDDNQVNRLVTSRMLEHLGCIPLQASGGQEGLDQIDERGPAIVLMDVEMPGMDGYETTRRIRESEQSGGRRLPVIALTAHAMEEHIHQAQAAGMDDHIAKPVTIDALLTAL